MSTESLLRRDPRRSWFTLAELIDSVLADAISADARFQLRQAEAWRGFAEGLEEVAAVPGAESIEFTAGLARLRNLAVTDLELALDLETRRPSWPKRMWWWVVGVFGVRPEPEPRQFRPARTRQPGRAELKIRVQRDPDGAWKIASAE